MTRKQKEALAKIIEGLMELLDLDEKAPRKETKTALIARMLTRKQGATRPELLSVLGWRAINVLDHAKVNSLNLRIDRSEGRYRYFGTMIN